MKSLLESFWKHFAKLSSLRFGNFNVQSNPKNFVAGALAFLGILTWAGMLESLRFLSFLPRIQFWLFGYLGYVWLFICAFWLYKSKASFDFKSLRFQEKVLGAVIGIFALLVLQGLFLGNVGIVGAAFNNVLKPIITPLGIFALTLFMLVFSAVLSSGKSFKELLRLLVQDLKEDIEVSKQQKEKIAQNKKRMKYFWLKTKAFFTPPSKLGAKNAARNATTEAVTGETKETHFKNHLAHNTKPTPSPMTLEELIEQNKNNPPPPQAVRFKFDEEEEEEEIVVTEESDFQEESLSEFAKKDFQVEIDVMRQGVELPMREDNPLENKKQSPAEQIRIVSQEEARQQDFNQVAFQKQSMESLKAFREFEKSNFYQKEEETKEESTIRLIKKESSAIQVQEQNQQSMRRDEQDKKPKQLIRAYPKNLYSFTPFSSYYDKEPVGARDCLTDNLEQHRTSQVQQPQKETLPATIFYYGDVASPYPLNAIPVSQQENPQENFETNQEDIIPQDDSPKIESNAELQSDFELPREELQEEFPQEQISAKQEEISAVAAEEKWEKEKKIDSIIPENLPSTNHLEVLPKEMQTHSDKEDLQESQISPFPVYGYGFTDYQTLQEDKDSKISEENIQISPNFNSLNFKQQEKPKQVEVMEVTGEQGTKLNQDSSSPELISLFGKAVENMPESKVNPQEIPQETQAQNKEQIAQQAVYHQEILSEPQATISPTQEIQPQEVAIMQGENKAILTQSQEFILPKLEFLQEPKGEHVEIDENEIDRKINDLLSKLRMFKIEGDIVRTYSGPIVTTFEFRPNQNVKVSRILALQDDLAMALRAKTIRIQAPVPGKDVVGIEIPNSQIETIYLREILENELFSHSSSPLTLALGKDIVGNPFVTDLKKLPHLLIAGTTGSGKSVGINAMILSLLYKNSPDNLKLLMIDPKMLEFSIYNDIPHLITPVITQPKKAIIALDNMVKEMERRYTLMSEARIKNIEGYNEKAEIEGFEPFPYIVVVIDELADLMMSGGKEAEVSISRLAQMARASGIHLIVATQRPSVDVVTGLIKANLPSRISYKVGQKIDSKVILDCFGAESLLGRGDMLFTPPGGGIVRLHAPWSTEKEIETIVEFIKSQRSPQYDERFMPSEDEVLGLHSDSETDDLYEEAKRIMLTDGKTSISYLQRRLGIGYNKAANIIEQMQARGFLSEPNSKNVREILGN